MVSDYARLHYLAYCKRSITLPEPPRGLVLRTYDASKSIDRFKLYGGDNWASTADVLCLDKNYWEKVAIPGETFYWENTFYLVKDDDETAFLFKRFMVNCGPMYREDTYDRDVLHRRRMLVDARRGELEDRLILTLAGV